MERIRVRSLHWAVGSLFAVIGAFLLIAPHQFSFISFPLLDRYYYAWAASLLLAGVCLIGITLFTPLRRVPVSIVHGLAALLLFGLSANYLWDEAWIGAINYALLDHLAAHLASRSRTRCRRPLHGLDWFHRPADWHIAVIKLVHTAQHPGLQTLAGHHAGIWNRVCRLRVLA